MIALQEDINENKEAVYLLNKGRKPKKEGRYVSGQHSRGFSPTSDR